MLQHCIPWNMRGGRLLFASLTALPLMARLVTVMLFAVPIAATGVAEVVHNAPRGFLGRHFWAHVGMLLLLMMPVAGKKRQAPLQPQIVARLFISRVGPGLKLGPARRTRHDTRRRSSGGGGGGDVAHGATCVGQLHSWRHRGDHVAMNFLSSA